MNRFDIALGKKPIRSRKKLIISQYVDASILNDVENHLKIIREIEISLKTQLLAEAEKHGYNILVDKIRYERHNDTNTGRECLRAIYDPRYEHDADRLWNRIEETKRFRGIKVYDPR